MGNDLWTAISRLVTSSSAFNTLNTPPAVPIYFQKSPDFPEPAGDGRGIVSLEFQVVANGLVVSRGTTGHDGKIDVRVPPGGSATVQLLVYGKVAAEYEVTVDDGALSDLSAGDANIDPRARAQSDNETVNAVSIRGTQERLRMLGYQIGHDGTEGTGVNGQMSAQWERAVLDFQRDQGLFADAIIGQNTKKRLSDRAKG